MIILKNNHFDDSKNLKNLAIKGIRCKVHFLITAHHQFLSFTRMSVICYPHKPPLSTKQVAKLNFLKILMTFLLQNRSQNFLLLLIQVLLILPNLWILGFAMSFPQVKNLFTFYSSSQNSDNEDYK